MLVGVNSQPKSFLVPGIALIVLLCLTKVASAQTTNPTFLPLDVGNTWTMGYVLQPPLEPPDTLTSATFEIVGQTVVDSNAYAVLSQNEGFVYADTLRMGHDGNIYALRNGTDLLLFDFAAEGDSAYTYPFEFDSLSYYVHVQKNVSVKTFVGTFEDCVSFFFDVPMAIDEELGYTFAPGVGLVAIGGAWQRGSLLAGQVGGTTYVTRRDKQTAPLVELQSMHPNPATSEVVFRIQSDLADEAAIEIFDVLGRKVAAIRTARLSAGQNDITFDVTTLAAGVYAARMSTNSASRFSQVVSFVVAR